MKQSYDSRFVEENFDPANWKKSKHSDPDNQGCVEYNLNGRLVAIRDSNHPERATLVFDAGEMSAFVKGLMDGSIPSPS